MVIYMQLAIMEWAKQPPNMIPHWVETCNATLAAIFAWGGGGCCRTVGAGFKGFLDI